jgi:hypothetical protein
MRQPAAQSRRCRRQARQSLYDLLTRIDCKFAGSTGRFAMSFDLLVAALVYGAVKWLTYLQ